MTVNDAASDRRICLGVFAGAHGVKGWTKIRTHTERPEDVAAYGPVELKDKTRRFTLEVVRILKKNLVLARAAEIESREDAAALSGETLFVDRSALPAPEASDEFYIEDLVGLSAFDDAGAAAGSVAAIHDFGAGSVLELEGVPGYSQPVLVPFTREAVPEVDIKGGRIGVARAFLDENEDDADARTRPDYIDAAMREDDA